MKKIFKVAIILLLTAVLFSVLSSCSSPHEEEKPNFYTVKYEVTEGGTIEGLETQTVEAGGTGNAVTAVPDYEYYFAGWSDGETSPTRQEVSVRENLSVTAIFKMLEMIDVTYMVEEGGSFVGISEQTIPFGKDAMPVTAIPDDGYVFVGWSDGILTETRKDKEITQSFDVTAHFQKKTLNLRYMAGEGGRIEGIASQTVEYGESATVVTAVPEMGYKFVRWNDGYGTNPVRMDWSVKSNITAIAEFALIFQDGRGTVQRPFTIDNYEHLLEIRKYPNLYCELSVDLDLSGISHEPLFDGLHMFTGVFDGKGHTVRNMRVDGYFANPSLFGYINTGTIKNLNITDFEITLSDYDTSNGYLCAGGVAAASWGVLDNIIVSGVIRANGLTHHGVAIGGLAGQVGNEISNCAADVKIEISNAQGGSDSNYMFNTGGLVGVGFANISACRTQGKIILTDVFNGFLAGGLVGYFMSDSDSTFGINDCFANVDIENSEGAYAKIGGLVAYANIAGGLKIDGCGITGNITSGVYAGGLMSYLTGYVGSKIAIRNSFVDNTMTCTAGAGFIFNLVNYDKSDLDVSNCYTKGDIHANMTAGFCYTVYGSVRFYRCFSATDIDTKAISATFIGRMTGGSVEECFSSGILTVEFQGSGFIFGASAILIKNCYSTSDINVINTDPDSEMRTLIGGMVVNSISGVELVNCYYSGKISGHVYTTSKVSGLGSIVGDFVGEMVGSQITNCHLLYYEDTFATNVVVGYYESTKPIDLTVYKGTAELSDVVDALNAGMEEPVWVTGENGVPKLLFEQKL